jgi:hypothetical protein
VSDDIPLIFAEEVRSPARSTAPSAIFLSAASAAQMQQYATAGWRVTAAPGFKASAEINLASVPASASAGNDPGPYTLLSCEAPYLTADTAARIKQWQPNVVKINCAFHNVADAGSLAAPLTTAGYTLLGAHWRDDNSFAIRSVERIAPLSDFQPPEWDRLNLIGVRDHEHAHIILTIARLYTGEEQRISELRVANMVRNDFIARLEDALIAQQPSDIFKLQRS